MAEKIAELYVDVNARLGKMEQKLKRAETRSKSASNKISGYFKSVGKAMAGMFAGVAITMGIKKLLSLGIAAKNAARDAEETRSKFLQVFSSIEGKAVQMADAFASSFKLATSTAEELLGSTGDLLVGFGFTEEAALDMSNQVNRLAQDLASFQNVDVTEASLALTKALLGETESAKALGIVIRQSTKEFTDNVDAIMKTQGVTLLQAKSIEILRIAYEQSGKAVGDFARTQDSLANQEKILGEQIKQLNIEVGQALIPVFNDAAGVAIDFFRSLTETDLEATIRELEELGSAAEVISRLKAQNKIVEALKEQRNIQEDINDLIFRAIQFSTQEFVDISDYFLFRDTVQEIANGTMSIADAQELVKSKVQELITRTKELADAQVKGTITKEIQGRVDQLRFEVKEYENLIVLLTRYAGLSETIKPPAPIFHLLGSTIPNLKDLTKTVSEVQKIRNRMKELEDIIEVTGETVKEVTDAKKEYNTLLKSLSVSTGGLKTATKELNEEQKKYGDFIKDLTGESADFKTRIDLITDALNKENVSFENQMILLNNLNELQRELTDRNIKIGIEFDESDAGLDFNEEDEKFRQEVTEGENQLQQKLEDERQSVIDAAREREEAMQRTANIMNSMIGASQTIASAFQVAGHTFVGQLSNALSIANQIASSILSVISAFGGGGGGFGIGGLISMLFGRHGGTFEGGRKVAAFAGGGDFIVPSPGAVDSFPMLVSPNERVRVTPTNKVSDELNTMKQLVTSVNAMNDNMVSKSNTINVQAILDGKIISESIYEINNRNEANKVDTEDF